jgi:hypothetical protein
MYKKDKALSRDWLANPHKDLPLYKRLEQNKSINLVGNQRVEDLGNGYDRIQPIDTDKRVTNK